MLLIMVKVTNSGYTIALSLRTEFVVAHSRHATLMLPNICKCDCVPTNFIPKHEVAVQRNEYSMYKNGSDLA